MLEDPPLTVRSVSGRYRDGLIYVLYGARGEESTREVRIRVFGCVE